MTRSNRHAEIDVSATVLLTGLILLAAAATNALTQIPAQSPATGMSVMQEISSAVASTGREGFYLFIVIFLVSINIAKFLLTNRINKKIDARNNQPEDAQ